MAEEKKMFIPASKFEAKPGKKINMTPPLPAVDEQEELEELDEATRSKYLKIYGKHKVGSDESKMNLARLKRDMAMLQRGGADAETMKKAAAASGRFNRNEKPDPSYNPNDAAMAGYRFASKATRSFDAAKKSPRKAAVSEANASKANKVYRKFGHGTEHDLAQLKRQVGVLRRGGASDETIRKFPKIAAKGGSHNQAEITTARANFMAGGARKRRLGINSPRTADVSEEWGGGFQSYKDAHKEVQAGLRRDASIQRRKMVADIKAVHSGKMTPAAFTRKHKTKFSELPLAKKMAASREKAKARYLAKKAAKAPAPKADSAPSIMEGFMRKRRLLRARTSGKTRTPEQWQALDTAYDSELGRRVARKLRHGGATKATMRSFINTDKPTTAAADRAFKKYNEAEWKKHQQLLAKGVHPKRLGFAESTEISEGSRSSKKLRRAYNKSLRKGKNPNQSVLNKMSSLSTTRALRGGASPEDVSNRMNDPKANARSFYALVNFHKRAKAKKNARGISEGSLGMKKGIRLGRAVRQKGHTNLGKRMDAAELRSFSKTRAEVGLDPRINVIPPKYKPSDAEYAAMQGHAEKRRKGINKKYGIDESISKKYKKTKKTAKRVLKKLRKALSTPRDAVDVMITGRNF